MKDSVSNEINDLPLISCICITNRRINLLKKSISYFKVQDYPNRELIISYPKSDRLTKYLVFKETRNTYSNIIGIERPDDQMLGDARNNAIEYSNGIYICTWDDDDWYHTSRLFQQFLVIRNAMGKYDASVISRVIFYDAIACKAYLSFIYPWENTLMCQKQAFLQYKYTSIDKGEDSKIIDNLDKTKKIAHMLDTPFLYIYTYHRGNVWNYSHFKSFYRRSELLQEGISDAIGTLIT